MAVDQNEMGDCFFYTKKSPFSNFHGFEFDHDDVRLPTSEHHLMYQKAKLMNDAETANKIMLAKTPLAAKRLGRKVTPWNQARWEANCDLIMEDILVSKFTASEEMIAAILDVSGKFYEASPRDKIWGIGISVDAALRGEPHRGENKLGKALDRARERVHRHNVARWHAARARENQRRLVSAD